MPTIAAARSLGAEWAMVNDLAARGRLTAAYADTMREDVRHQLLLEKSALKQPSSNYGRQIEALLQQPANASPQVLRTYSARLKQIERSLESA